MLCKYWQRPGLLTKDRPLISSERLLLDDKSESPVSCKVAWTGCVVFFSNYPDDGSSRLLRNFDSNLRGLVSQKTQISLFLVTFILSILITCPSHLFLLISIIRSCFLYRSFATRVSQLKIWHFWVTGIVRNVCRCTFNRYSVITQFVKLAAGEQLCRRCTHRKI